MARTGAAQVLDKDRPGRSGVRGEHGGVVDFLGQRLRCVERRDEGQDSGQQHEWSGARVGASQRQCGPHDEDQHTYDPHGRPTQQALQIPGQHGEATPQSHRQAPDQWPVAGSLGRELSAQKKHRAQVLLGDREAELADELGPAAGALDRQSADPQHSKCRDHDRYSDRPERPGPGVKGPEDHPPRARWRAPWG
ncbi:MAG: hypothetical protein V9E94_11770 [Microthrixaceae bacterium]